MAEAAHDWWTLYRARIAAARDGRVCDRDREAGQKLRQVGAVSETGKGGWLFPACTIAAYVATVSLAFAVHPLLGLLFLWLGLYIAPIAAAAVMVVAPFALLAVLGFTGLALLFIYWP